jgi:hypothetical protein
MRVLDCSRAVGSSARCWKHQTIITKLVKETGWARDLESILALHCTTSIHNRSRMTQNSHKAHRTVHYGLPLVILVTPLPSSMSVCADDEKACTCTTDVSSACVPNVHLTRPFTGEGMQRPIAGYTDRGTIDGRNRQVYTWRNARAKKPEMLDACYTVMPSLTEKDVIHCM